MSFETVLQDDFSTTLDGLRDGEQRHEPVEAVEGRLAPLEVQCAPLRLPRPVPQLSARTQGKLSLEHGHRVDLIDINFDLGCNSIHLKTPKIPFKKETCIIY